MRIREFAKQLKMEILTEEKGLEKEVKGIYICDLLSWVMSHAVKGDAWVTVHTHVNIVAVALMVDIPCIIIPEGIEVEEAALKKACEEDIAILRTSKSSYEIACEAGKLL